MQIYVVASSRSLDGVYRSKSAALHLCARINTCMGPESASRVYVCTWEDERLTDDGGIHPVIAEWAAERVSSGFWEAGRSDCDHHRQGERCTLERRIMQEADMRTLFLTMADATAAGWIPAHSVPGARDVSGRHAFGYAYEVMRDGEAVRSTGIYITEQRNKLGHPGAVSTMFHKSQL